MNLYRIFTKNLKSVGDSKLFQNAPNAIWQILLKHHMEYGNVQVVDLVLNPTGV